MRKVSDMTLEVINLEKRKAFMNYGLCDDLFAGLRYYEKIATRLNRRKVKGLLNQRLIKK